MRKRASVMLLLSSTVIAGAQSPSAQDRSKGTKDPDEWICEKQTVIGTRLATRRVCATRAEWDERRRLDKEAIDKAQTQIGVIKI